MAQATGQLVFEDYNGEISRMNVHLNSFEPPNLLPPNWGSITTDLDEVKAAINGASITVGEIREVNISVDLQSYTAPVTDYYAARESKWLVTCRDTTPLLASGIANPGYGKLFQFEIPTAKRALLLDHASADDEDVLDLTESPIQEFVATIEAALCSPWNHSVSLGITPTIQVEKIQYVGRNI